MTFDDILRGGSIPPKDLMEVFRQKNPNILSAAELARELQTSYEFFWGSLQELVTSGEVEAFYVGSGGASPEQPGFVYIWPPGADIGDGGREV